MNVLYILSSTVFGGATLSFLSLIKGLKPLGVQPFVVIPNRDPELERALNDLHVEYFIVPIVFACYPHIDNWKSLLKSPWTFLKMVGCNLVAVSRMKRIINQKSINLVHTNVGPVYAGHYVAKLCKIPHVWHVREYGDLDFKFLYFPSKSFFRKILAKDISICITYDLLRYNQLGSKKNAFVVYNGVRKKSLGNSLVEKGKYFLCASRISPEKGIDSVIRVFAAFIKENADYKLIVLGKGTDEYEDKLKMLASELDLNDKVIFKGFRQDVFEFMKKAKALIVASPSEGFGRMTAEACFAGCLVIGRNTAGTKEILDRTGGLLFNNSAELLLQMKNAALMNDADYESITRHAQVVANECFSEESYVQSVWNIYKTCG